MVHLRSVEIESDWIDEFPFLELAVGPASIVGPVLEIRPGNVRVPDLVVCSATLGNLSAAYPDVVGRRNRRISEERVSVAGTAHDVKMATVRAVAEAVERYAGFVALGPDILRASANELGHRAVAWQRMPCGSKEEYEVEQPLLLPFDPDDEIGWVPGISMRTGERKYIPLVLTHLAAGDPGGRYWLPISTGMAAHTSLEQATVNGLCEVIERDAIALTWLLRRRLHRIVVKDDIPDELVASMRAVERSGVEHLMFDATTDVGIPTVYAVQLRDGAKGAATVVSCATSISGFDAMEKTIRECASTAIALEDAEAPATADSIVGLEDGAAWMGQPIRRDAFNFLTESRTITDVPTLDEPPRNPTDQLAFVVSRLAAAGMEPFVVDVTPHDIRPFGIVVVRALVFELMPISYASRFRYLGHDRLSRFAKYESIDLRGGAAINEWPQPFA